MLPPPPRSTLFPYTTLFRSFRQLGGEPNAAPLTPPWFLPGAEDLWKRIAETERALRGVVRDIYATRFRSEEHTSELQSHSDLVCRLLLEKKKKHIVSMNGSR